jgi:hypothetical protein
MRGLSQGYQSIIVFQGKRDVSTGTTVKVRLQTSQVDVWRVGDLHHGTSIWYASCRREKLIS